MLFFKIVVYASLGFHWACLVYLALGGFLAWRWRWAIVPHVLYFGWAIATLFYNAPCPVTGVENWARARAGWPLDTAGFVNTYVAGVLYPGHHINRARVVFLALILISWAGFLWRQRILRGGPPAGRHERRNAARRAKALPGYEVAAR